MKAQRKSACVVVAVLFLLSGCSSSLSGTMVGASLAVGAVAAISVAGYTVAKGITLHPSSTAKPYGTYWVKEGWTTDQRREDSWACGASRATTRAADYVIFPREEIDRVKLPEDPNDINAIGRLTKNWVICMKEKGYHYEE